MPKIPEDFIVSKESIYKSSEGEAELTMLYDKALDSLGIEYEDRMVDTRFGATHVLVSGPKGAPPLFVLHGGNSTNPLTFSWFLPFTEDYRLYAPDTIGHPGKSAQIRLSPSDNSYGQWVTDVLDALNLEQVPFIGPSYGAGIILRTAAHAPERISKAVLLVPAGIASVSILRMTFQIAFPMMLYRWFPGRKRLIRAVRWMHTGDMDEISVQTTGAVFRHVKLETKMPRLATKEELMEYKAPTLVLAAENDALFPADKVLPRAKEIIPDLVAAECLEGSSHLLSKQMQEYVQSRIRRFMEETK